MAGVCVVFLGKTLSQCLSPPRSIIGYRRQNAGVNLRWTSIPSRGSRNTPGRLHATQTGISSGLPFYLTMFVQQNIRSRLTQHFILFSNLDTFTQKLNILIIITDFHPLLLERFSVKCLKTKTKAITMANHNKRI